MENIRWSPPRGLLFVEFVLPADLRENLTPLLCELDENIFVKIMNTLFRLETKK